MKLRHALAATAALSLAGLTSAAQADTYKGNWYGQLSAGASLQDDTDFNTAGTIVDNEYDLGYALSGALGYDFGKVWEHGGLRLEGEISYRDIEIDTHSVGGASQPQSTGELGTVAYMANIYHDFWRDEPLRPYVGAGIGIADVDFDGFGIAGAPNALNDDQTAFAYQVIAGASYDIDPSWTVSADYRYFAAEPEVTAAGNTSNDVDIDNHSFLVGLRLNY